MSLMASYVGIAALCRVADGLCLILIEPSRNVVTGPRVIPARGGGFGGHGRTGRCGRPDSRIGPASRATSEESSGFGVICRDFGDDPGPDCRRSQGGITRLRMMPSGRL